AGPQRARAVGPDRLHDRPHLVALDARVDRLVADLAEEVVEVRAADPDRGRPHDHLARPRVARRLQVAQLHHAALGCDRRPHEPWDISSCPPSTGITAPVMKLDAGDASSSATPLSSSGSAMRPIATMPAQAS